MSEPDCRKCRDTGIRVLLAAVDPHLVPCDYCDEWLKLENDTALVDERVQQIADRLGWEKVDG